MMESFAKYFVLCIQNIISGREWREREQELKRGEERERERGRSQGRKRKSKHRYKEKPKKGWPPPPSAFAHLIEDRVPSSCFDVCAIVLV